MLLSQPLAVLPFFAALLALTPLVALDAEETTPLPSRPQYPAKWEPLFDFPVRDTCVCLGPDGTYYLTGTTGHPTWWKTNEGIRVWKSKDLKTWEPLGLVWSFVKDATWQKPKGESGDLGTGTPLLQGHVLDRLLR